MWKQLKPATLDKLALLILNGSLSSKTGNVKTEVTVEMLGFYRLSFAKHTLAGKTTSRQATPLGDGRGVPKQFRDFGRFSKFSTVFSQTTLPAGFALGRKSVLHGYNPSGTVTVFVVQGLNSRLTLIRTDIAKMDHNDPFLQRLVDQFCPDILDLDIGDMGGTSDMGDLSFLATTDEVLIANLPSPGFP